MKKQYAVTLVLASLVIIALAAVAGSGSSVSDLPAPLAAEKTWPDCRVFCRLATPPARAPLPSPQLRRSPP